MRNLTLLVMTAALAFAAFPAPAAAELQRRALLGISMPPDRQSGNGATVAEVTPAGTAAAIGLQPGDTIVRAGDRQVTAPPQIISYAASLFGGMPVSLTVRRDGREIVLRGPAIERPRDAYAGARVDYGAVPHDGGELRDILVTPDGVENPPVVYLIQGFTCVTMELPAYHALGAALVGAGIGFYRVEKLGVGDSRSPRHCTGADYAAELDGFRAAYRHLIAARGVEADRIFMLGHSMGGLQAPMLAAETPPRGVAVFGTVFRNWADYHRELSQFQPFLNTGGDLAAMTATAEAFRDAIRRFYFLREAPATVAAADPVYDAGLREYFGWDGGERMYGRHYKFMQDLAHLPLIAAWRDTRTNILSIYGESDVVALFDTDHRLIADFINQQRPGTAGYAEIPRTGHAMDVIGNRDEIRDYWRANNATPTGPFNPEVVRVLAEWIRASMASPPVRERYPAAPAAAG